MFQKVTENIAPQNFMSQIFLAKIIVIICELDLFRNIPWMHNWITIWRIWKPSRQLKLFVTFLGPFLKFFGMSGHILLLLTPLLLLSAVAMGGCTLYLVCVLCCSGIHMNARTQGFPAKYYAEMNDVFSNQINLYLYGAFPTEKYRKVPYRDVQCLIEM